MDWDIIQAQYEEDIRWSIKDLTNVLNLHPSIISKYQNIWYSLKSQIDKKQKEYDDTWISRFLFYKHDFSITLSNTEIKTFLDRDTELNNLKYEIESFSTKINLVEKWLKNLDGMRYDFKLIVDWEKFKNGEY